jgi:hypothetical protein
MPTNYGKFTVNGQYKNPQTVREIYRRGCQLYRLGYDPRTTLEPHKSSQFIHHTNLRIADLAYYSMKNRLYCVTKLERSWLSGKIERVTIDIL